MRAALAFAVVLIAVPACTAAAEQRFTFPGDEASSASPAGGLVASYKANDAGPARFIVAAKGEEVAGFEFLRTVDGVWRDKSDALFVNNHVGSNTSDCLVLTSVEGKYNFTSLRGLLDREGSIGKDSEWIKPAQLARDAEYRLVCEDWDDAAHIDITITGNTGAEAFKYALQVDLASGVFKFRK
jgi:hypothetical protein